MSKSVINGFKLKKKVKNTWVKALRSGKYNQTQEALKDKTGFCCLGVLKECVPGIKQTPNKELLTEKSSGIPEEIQQKLADMNDGFSKKPKSFNYIASWIEKYL